MSNTAQRDRAAALQFQSCSVRYLLGPWVAELIGRAAPAAGDRVLDIACGTGAVTRKAARAVGATGSVIGLDINPKMLAVAREMSEASILWQTGNAVSLPFADGRFDIVLCQQGLQFFTNRQAAVNEMHRMLAPGGRVTLLVWSGIEDNPYFLAMAGAMERFLGDDAGAPMFESCSLGDSGEIRRLLQGAGFESIDVGPLSRDLHLPPLAEFAPEHIAGTHLARTFAAAPAESRKQVIDGMLAELAAVQPGGATEMDGETEPAGRSGPAGKQPAAMGVTLPFAIQMATARR